VVVEVAGDEGDVDVAGLADGLAVVEGLEDDELLISFTNLIS
jgi:hypothetical protein